MTDHVIEVIELALAVEDTSGLSSPDHYRGLACRILAAVAPLIRAQVLEEAVGVLEALSAWYETHGDTKAPLAPWVAADKLLTRLRAVEAEKDGWQPIATAPSLVRVLVGRQLSPRRWFETVAEKIPALADAWVCDSGEMTLEPTHYHLLPPPPKPEDQP